MSEERLARIETKLDAMIDKVNGRIEHDDNRWNRMNRTVYGFNGSPGLLIKLDRLEQAQERSRWLMRTMVGAVAVLFVGGVWSILVG